MREGEGKWAQGNPLWKGEIWSRQEWLREHLRDNHQEGDEGSKEKKGQCLASRACRTEGK